MLLSVFFFYTVTKIGLPDRERILILMGCLGSEAKQLKIFLRICHAIYGRVEGGKIVPFFFFFYTLLYYYYFSIIKKKGIEEKRSNERCVGAALILYLYVLSECDSRCLVSGQWHSRAVCLFPAQPRPH